MASELVRVVDWGGGVGNPFGSGPYLVVPSDHNIARFSLLTKRGNIEIEAWFTARAPKEQEPTIPESEWPFTYRWMPTVRFGGRWLSTPVPLFPNGKPDVFLTAFADPSLLGTWLVARLLGVKGALYMEKTSPAWSRRSRLKEALKRRIVPLADGVLTQGPDGAGYARSYGAARNRIHCARHGISIEVFNDAFNARSQNRRESREQLGLKGITYIYVGRLWTGKGVDDLIEAFASVSEHYPEKVSLLLAGSGPDEGRFRRRAADSGAKGIVFAGRVPPSRISAMYCAADVFVFPSLGDTYGIVIDEAMASHLPVIAATSIGEVGVRVIDGKNGYLIAPNNSVALADRMERFVRNPDLITSMGAESWKQISSHTLDQWAGDFERAVEQIAAG